MSRIEELDSLIQLFDLNQHPFYQEWRAGTLPLSKLTCYAGEYGEFVSTIADGWETLGEGRYAEEERVHTCLWNDFRTAVGYTVRAERAQTEVLVHVARILFVAGIPEAAGSLYAFEAQQPVTSQSKLDGLNEHYRIDDGGKEYFRVHAGDFAEAEDIRRLILTMTDEEFAQVKTSCAVVCASMWAALDGVYYTD